MKKLILLVFVFSNILYGCTIFNIQDYNQSILVGRSFDWSIDSGSINFISSSRDNNGIVIISQRGVDMPYEGMNDKGLFVGISAVPSTSTPINIFKPIRKSLEMVKIVLQKADTLNSALEIFSKYMVIFGEFLGNPLVHFKK